jgi:hypothetical protein
MTCIILPMIIPGTRFEAARNTCKVKDAATKHENQADCPWHNRGAHSDRHPVSVPWIQVQVEAAKSSNRYNCHYITLLLLRAKTIWCYVLSSLSVLWPGSRFLFLFLRIQVQGSWGCLRCRVGVGVCYFLRKQVYNCAETGLKREGTCGTFFLSTACVDVLYGDVCVRVGAWRVV